MDYRAMLAIGLPLGLGIAALGSGIGLGKAVAAALRQLLELFADSRHDAVSCARLLSFGAAAALFAALAAGPTKITSPRLLTHALTAAWMVANAEPHEEPSWVSLPLPYCGPRGST